MAYSKVKHAYIKLNTCFTVTPCVNASYSTDPKEVAILPDVVITAIDLSLAYYHRSPQHRLCSCWISSLEC